MKISKRWRKIAEVYKHFAKGATRTGFVCDFSENAAREMYIFESQGRGRIKPDNGFAIGKKWLDVTVAMWREDLKANPPMLYAAELYSDPNLPDWWLDNVVGQFKEISNAKTDSPSNH